MVEYLTFNQTVIGSSPVIFTSILQTHSDACLIILQLYEHLNMEI